MSILDALTRARACLRAEWTDSIVEALCQACGGQADRVAYACAIAVCQGETPGVNLSTWEALHPERAERLALLERVIARERANAAVAARRKG